MAKKPIVVGNWKMELSHKAAVEVARAMKKIFKDFSGKCDIVACPSFPSLEAVNKILDGDEGPVAVGAQNIFHADRGAQTGQVSATQIRPFVQWCIIGHSENRSLTGETDEQVLLKANLLLQHGINPIICIGESAQERAADQTVEKITRQIQVLLSGLDRSSLTRVVICYEPIWAISAVRVAAMPDPREISETAMLIRKLTAEHFDQDILSRLRIMYGGSVNEKNVADYVKEPGIDGVLVGSASILPRVFAEIAAIVVKEWQE